MSNEAFEKWAIDYGLDYESSFTRDDVEASWQAAKADSEQEIAELKETINELRWMQGINTDYATAELQAHINDLRETLEWIDRDYGTIGIHSIVTSALSTTPAQSLQEHDNEVIEKCAKICDGYTHGAWFADKIRALKGKL